MLSIKISLMEFGNSDEFESGVRFMFFLAFFLVIRQKCQKTVDGLILRNSTIII